MPWQHPLAFMTGDPRWMTYQQAKSKDWQVKRGAKSATVFFYKPLSVEDAAARDGHRTVPLLRSYSLFHGSQVERVPTYRAPTVEEAPWTRPEATQTILNNSGATISIGGDRAFYSPATDHIRLPPDDASQIPPERFGLRKGNTRRFAT
jgi:antirestriction protein ArdC